MSDATTEAEDLIMGRIVVGVDGSEHSRSALRWAVQEAAVRGDRVEALMAWHEPYVGGTWEIPIPIDVVALEKSHRLHLDQIVEDADVTTLREPIERTLARGSAASCLIDAARDADLLVVGSRGRGGFVGLVLGSVSQQVAIHAPCPVVIVHPGDSPDGDHER